MIKIYYDDIEEGFYIEVDEAEAYEALMENHLLDEAHIEMLKRAEDSLEVYEYIDFDEYMDELKDLFREDAEDVYQLQNDPYLYHGISRSDFF